jgi:DNA polymerase-3 subunit alpha
MASLVIEDNTRKINAVLFTKSMGANSDLLVLDEVVVITGKVRKDFRDQWQVVIERIEPVEKVQTKYAKYLQLSLNDSQQLNYINLAELLKNCPGKCPVMIQYRSKKAYGRFPLESEYCVTIKRELLDRLEQLIGQENCRIQY